MIQNGAAFPIYPVHRHREAFFKKKLSDSTKASARFFLSLSLSPVFLLFYVDGVSARRCWHVKRNLEDRKSRVIKQERTGCPAWIYEIIAE